MSIAVRPTLLFVTAYMVTMTSHEIVHALAAYWLGFASTVFHLWVTPDRADATPSEIAIIAASGPIFSLAIGALGWIAYTRWPGSSSELVSLFFGIIGTYAFLGPLAGGALGGDGNTVLRALNVPASYRYVVSAAGAFGLAAFMFFVGRVLVRAAPHDASRGRAVVTMVLAPWFAGTLLSVLLYLPLPSPLVASTIAGSAFWLFAAIGAAATSAAPRRSTPLRVRYLDLGLALAALLVVRVLVSGVRLIP